MIVDHLPFAMGCIFFGIGALLIGSLIGYLVQRLRSRMSEARTVGRVIELETLSSTVGKQTLDHAADAPPADPSGNLYYRSVVEYTVDGKTYRCRGAYSMQKSTTLTTNLGNQATFEKTTAPLDEDIGQTVPVAYSRSDPSNAFVINAGRDLQVYAAQIFFGLMFMVLGLLAFYLNGNLAWLGPDWQRYEP